MWIAFSYLAYLITLVALGVAGEFHGIWQREEGQRRSMFEPLREQGRRMVFEPPLTVRVVWPMILGFFIVGPSWILFRAVHLAVLHPSSQHIVIPVIIVFNMIGVIFIITVMARDLNYRMLEIDLERRTFRFERLWPFCTDSGSLDEVSGIRNAAGTLSLDRKSKMRLGARGYTLGTYSNRTTAAATAERLAAEMGLTVVSAPQ